MKPILEIQNISKKFRIYHEKQPYLSLRDSLTSLFKPGTATTEEFYALKDVSFQAQPGESIGIIGRNGAGKSTLLKVLSKITPPSEGKIICRGRIASLLEVGTGFHPELTGSENIFLNGSILGMRRKEIQAKFDEIVDFSGVENFLDTPLKHYSSGMQLRLAFSVAAFLDPEILIIDEVLAVGDAQFQQKCMGKMSDVSKSGRTILFVSHNMTAVSQLCRKAILMNEGKKIEEGNPDFVINQYTKREYSQTSLAEKQIELANGLWIRDLSFNKPTLFSLEDFSLSFTLESDKVNPMTGLALLIYNSLNERVGILDFRSEDLFTRSTTQQKLMIKADLRKIPLLEGVYYAGIYMASNLFEGHYYNLAKFEVHHAAKDILPYDAKHRGLLEFDYDFKIM